MQKSEVRGQIAAAALLVANAVPAAVTLTGGTTLNMSNNANNVIGIFGGGLTNVNNTIQGVGQIGNAQMGLNNQGTGGGQKCPTHTNGGGQECPPHTAKTAQIHCACVTSRNGRP